MIIQKASARDIRHKAEAQGMSTLQTSGWEQCKRGVTSLDEIMRYADLIVEDEAPAVPEEEPPPLT